MRNTGFFVCQSYHDNAIEEDNIRRKNYVIAF